MNISDAASLGYKHHNLLFWAGMLKSLADPIRSTDRILDFGCGDGLFLQVLHDFHPYQEGIGIDRDDESIRRARLSLTQRSNSFPITYLDSESIHPRSYKEYFDLIFCQEVLWMNDNLESLAKRLFSMLKAGGKCYCTMGAHADNPLWLFKREQMEAEGFATNTWSIDHVARIFSEAGFAVGVRRIPVEGFIMFHPEITPIRSRSLAELVQTTAEHKMLFYFGKHEPVEKNKRIQG